MSIRWNFPGEFSQAVLTHHCLPDGRVRVIDIVREADAFACGREGTLPEKERTALEQERTAIEAETERIRLLLGA